MLEPSWPHLQVVYEFFLRFVVSAEVKAKVREMCSGSEWVQGRCASCVELICAQQWGGGVEAAPAPVHV